MRITSVALITMAVAIGVVIGQDMFNDNDFNNFDNDDGFGGIGGFGGAGFGGGGFGGAGFGGGSFGGAGFGGGMGSHGAFGFGHGGFGHSAGVASVAYPKRDTVYMEYPVRVPGVLGGNGVLLAGALLCFLLLSRGTGTGTSGPTITFNNGSSSSGGGGPPIVG